MTRRRAIAFGAVVVLLLGALVVVILYGSDRCDAQAHGQPAVLAGIVGSESASLLSDSDVARCLQEADITLAAPDQSGSLDMGNRGDLGSFGFALPSSAPAADRLRQSQGDRGSQSPFFSPMVVVTYRPVVDSLRRAGLVGDGPDGAGTLDVAGLIRRIDRGDRWRDLPGNEVPTPDKAILLGTTDPEDSNSASMFLSLAAYALNGDSTVTSPGQFDPLIPALCPVFERQGYKERTTGALFARYLNGIGDTPMALVYEHQFRAALNAGRLGPDQVVLYPSPTVLSRYTLVPLPSPDPAARDATRRLGLELIADPGVVERVVALGFRPTQPPDGAPERLPNDVVDTPSYEVLNALVARVVQECR